MFAISGMQLFADTKYGLQLNPNSSFSNFGESMLTLLKVASGSSPLLTLLSHCPFKSRASLFLLFTVVAFLLLSCTCRFSVPVTPPYSSQRSPWQDPLLGSLIHRSFTIYSALFNLLNFHCTSTIYSTLFTASLLFTLPPQLRLQVNTFTCCAIAPSSIPNAPLATTAARGLPGCSSRFS